MIAEPSKVCAPDGADVFVGVSPLLSGAIADRLTRASCRFHAANPLDGTSEPPSPR